MVGILALPRAYDINTGALEITRWNRGVISSKTVLVFAIVSMFAGLGIEMIKRKGWTGKRRVFALAGLFLFVFGLVNLLGATAAPLPI